MSSKTVFELEIELGLAVKHQLENNDTKDMPICAVASNWLD